MMAALVGLPLALGALGVLLGPRRAARLALPGVGLMSAAAAYIGFRVIDAGPQREALGGWRAPLGIELYADGLSALMIATTALVGALALVLLRRLHDAGGGATLDADPPR